MPALRSIDARAKFAVADLDGQGIILCYLVDTANETAVFSAHNRLSSCQGGEGTDGFEVVACQRKAIAFALDQAEHSPVEPS